MALHGVIAGAARPPSHITSEYPWAVRSFFQTHTQYITHIHTQTMHTHILCHLQCILYDSADPGARLIGIEYIISRRLFEVGGVGDTIIQIPLIRSRQRARDDAAVLQ